MYHQTRFSELLKGLPRRVFDKAVKQNNGNKYSKGFSCWDQLITMLYAQLSGCKSLRELEAGFNSNQAYHYHLGSRQVKRSTLSEANKKRCVKVFSDTCEQLMNEVHSKFKGEMYDLLYLLDSTPIPLKGLGYEWTKKELNSQNSRLQSSYVVCARDCYSFANRGYTTQC